MADDQLLARSALEKRKRGEKPTREEERALRRVERQREEELRWKFYAAIPQKHWREMSGRQTKVLQDQAALHGVPVDGKEISLPAVARWLHDFLAEHKALLSAAKRTEEVKQSQIERYRAARAGLVELELDLRREEVVPVAVMRDALFRIFGILRGYGEKLQRDHDPAAFELWQEYLSDASDAVDRLFGEEESEPVPKASDQAADP